MNTRLRMKRRRRLPAGAGQWRGRNAGFTLVELLAVITVMAILAGILVPVIFSALNTANEFTITSEVQQLDAAVEKFKTQYGFYPPTIGTGTQYEINSVDDMRRYLNRVSPNHSEGNGTAGTRLYIWWDEVGQYLDDRSSLVFWLSGLAKNKQFPLSGFSTNPGMALKPYNVGKYANNTDLPVEVERDEFFEFEIGRVQEETIGGALRLAGYVQPAGDSDGDLYYRYRDSKSYEDEMSGAPLAYFLGANGFLNPESFQIACPGMDGLPGGPLDLTDQTPTPALPQRDDNIANFADGRIEKFVNENL